MSRQPPAPWKVIDTGVDGRDMWTGWALRIHTWVCLHCWEADVTPATWAGAIDAARTHYLTQHDPRLPAGEPLPW